MGKYSLSDSNDQQLEEFHPGCMWGIIHAFGYHHWNHNVQKMLPHRKNNTRRHAKGNGGPKTRLDAHDSSEIENLLDAEAGQFLDTRETRSNNKRSLMARIRALIAEEMSKEENCNQKRSGFTLPSQLGRTYSIHHLQTLDHGPHGKSSGWRQKIIFLHSKAGNGISDPAHMKDTDKPISCEKPFGVCSIDNVVHTSEHDQLAGNREFSADNGDRSQQSLADIKLFEPDRHHGNALTCKSKDDVLEIFRVNKDLFQEALHSVDDGIANHLHSPLISDKHTRLNRSGSFPVAGLSHGRNVRSSKLKHKIDEVWSFRKGGLLLTGTQAPKFSKDCHTKSGPLPVDYDDVGDRENQDAKVSSLVSAKGLENVGNNEGVICPFNEMKQKEEHDIKEVADNPSNARRAHIRRTSSLKESLDRYTRLFENTFGRDTSYRSQSLKLRNEYEITSDAHAPITFKRVHSLSHTESYDYPKNEQCHDVHYSGPLLRTGMDSSRNVEIISSDRKMERLSLTSEECVPLDDNQETGYPRATVEKSAISRIMDQLSNITEDIIAQDTGKTDRLSGEMAEQAVVESNSCEELENTSIGTANDKLPQTNPASDVDSSPEEVVTFPCTSPVSEGLQGRRDYDGSKESLDDAQYLKVADSLSSLCGLVNPDNNETAGKFAKVPRQTKSHTTDSSELNYVRKVLEQSGYINDLFGAWHSFDQPLDPSLFEDVETYWPHEPEHFGEEDISTCSHHQILFDLINEALIQISDRSFTYYPRALSSNCCIRLVPEGNHILQEVWTCISRSLNMRLQLDQPLDGIVAQDFEKDDGWMNLQFESESVALELDDLIIDELLEELIYS